MRKGGREAQEDGGLAAVRAQEWEGAPAEHVERALCVHLESEEAQQLSDRDFQLRATLATFSCVHARDFHGKGSPLPLTETL